MVGSPYAPLLALEELKNRGIGIAENLASMVTSGGADILSGYTGMLALPFGHDKATKVINNVRDKLTLQPQSQGGKMVQQDIGNAMNKVGEAYQYVASETGFDPIANFTESADYVGERSPFLGAAIQTLPTAASSLTGLRFAPKIGKSYELGNVPQGMNKNQRGVFAGIKSKTADLEAQAAAEELSRRGVSAEDIFYQTGWFQGVDGQWRYEIDDSKSQFLHPTRSNRADEFEKMLDDLNKKSDDDLLIEDRLDWELGGKNPEDYTPRSADEIRKAKAEHLESLLRDVSGSKYPLKSILINKDVYEGYPDIGDIRTRIGNLDQKGASYSPSTDPSKESISIGNKADNMRSVTIHETQHAIQEREGFSRGGNPDEFYISNLGDYAKAANLGIEAEVRAMVEDGMSFDEIIKETEGIKRFENLYPIFDNIKKRPVSEYSAEQAHSDYKSAMARVKENYKDPYEQYQRLYGEAEARLVQERMNMTEAERKAYPPMKHLEDMLKDEGINMDELVVRGESGVMASTPRAKAAQEELKRRGVDTFSKNDGYKPYTQENVEGLAERFSSHTWGSIEEARKSLKRNIEHNNNQFGGIFGKTNPSMADEVKIVKKGKGYTVSLRGKSQKPVLDVFDEPIGESPYGNFSARDLEDTGKGIMADYGRGKGEVKSGYVDIDILPKAKLAGGKNAYDWSELERGGEIPPIKIRKNKNGSITILDGNHRLEYFRDKGYESIPAFVIDEGVK